MQDESHRIIQISDDDRKKFKRLDHCLVEVCPDLSRSLIKHLFDSGDISSQNVAKLSLNKMPPTGTEIEIELPPPLPTELVAQNIPLEILFEDEWLVVVNKPAGLCVHPAPGHPDQTLVNAILWHCPTLKGIGQEKRPGIVHRLDLGTSGVMVIAKEHTTHEGLVELFSSHAIERIYEAITWGVPPQASGKIETLINRHPQNRLKMSAQVTKGKTAITNYQLLKKHANCPLSNLQLKLETGRTHQIRVHLSQILHTPILNDELYSHVNHQKKQLPLEIVSIFDEYPHPFLHAKVLGFIHPKTKALMRWEVDPPNIFKKLKEEIYGR